MASLPDEKTKVCPKCGKQFGCAPHDCWCSKLPHMMPMNAEAECYCPECLDAIIKERTQPAATTPRSDNIKNNKDKSENDS
jgi:hypothetical protein